MYTEVHLIISLKVMSSIFPIALQSAGKRAALNGKSIDPTHSNTTQYAPDQ